MATIDISRNHTLPIADAKKKAEELAAGMATKLGIVWSWENDSIVFHAPTGVAKGAKGTVNVTPSTVRVQVDLPFMLKMMKGTIEEKINEKLKTLL